VNNIACRWSNQHCFLSQNGNNSQPEI